MLLVAGPYCGLGASELSPMDLALGTPSITSVKKCAEPGHGKHGEGQSGTGSGSQAWKRQSRSVATTTKLAELERSAKRKKRRSEIVRGYQRQLLDAVALARAEQQRAEILAAMLDYLMSESR